MPLRRSLITYVFAVFLAFSIARVFFKVWSASSVPCVGPLDVGVSRAVEDMGKVFPPVLCFIGLPFESTFSFVIFRFVLTGPMKAKLAKALRGPRNGWLDMVDSVLLGEVVDGVEFWYMS